MGVFMYLPGVRSFFCVIVSCLILLYSVQNGFCGKDKFVETDEYKGKDFHKGCISDYKNLMEGDDLKWVWIAPDSNITEYSLIVTSFKDLSGELRKSQLSEVKEMFTETLGKIKGGKGTLKADVCIYEVQKFSQGKAWIPFAGGHQMQAGVGAELVLRNNGKIVAMIRHFAREGARVEDAAQEVADDMKKFLKDQK
jgi:hypothetical protein